MTTTNVTRVDQQGHIPIPEDLRYRYRLHPGSELAWRDPGDGTLVLNLKPEKNLTDVRAALTRESPPKLGRISTRGAIATSIREKHKHAGG